MKYAFSLVVFGCMILIKAFGADIYQPQSYMLCYEDQHFPPFVMGTSPAKANEPGGILVEYVQRSAAQLGDNIVLVRYPWLRCQQAVKSGQVDGLFAFIYSDERDQWAAFPKTNGRPDDRYSHLGRYVIFTAIDSSLTWDGTTLLPTSAVVQSIPGYIADKKLQDMGFKPVMNLQPKDALPLLANGRIDGFVMDELIGLTLIKQLGLEDKITQLPVSFLDQPWYVAFSKQRYEQDAQSIEAFWSAIAAIREQNGADIIKSYLNTP